MKKIWGFVATLFIGFSAGLIFAVKWLVQNKIIVNVKKQRIRGNENRMIVDVVPMTESPPKRLKRTKKQRKADREQRRTDKKQKNGGA